MLNTLGNAAPVVYPTPQIADLSDTFTRVTQVRTQLRQADSQGGLWDRLPAGVEGGYALQIEPGTLTICANDPHGFYYAKQTLSQLLQGVPNAQHAQKDPFPQKSIKEVAQMGKLPQGTLIDWPDLPFRGAVEGYYGTPWSFEARRSQFEFYGRNKMNTYIYAPKDDPYHHGMGCYKPYPEDKAKEIAQLVKLAQDNHVKFVWAIHPANTVNWADNEGRHQLDALCHKLELMYQLGVRDFGVLVDDSSGEIGRAERQVQLTNYLLEHFIRKHQDVNQTLIMCPTGYNRSWTNPTFLTTLGQGLDASIPIMWTGDTVVHDITLDGQKWVNHLVQRPTFIWWNWPCSDFKRSRLSMGRTYGLDTSPDMKKEMSGFVANPMEHAEASKIGLFGVADYTWNITAFQSQASWQEGIRRLYPGQAEAMQAFCDHNSYLLPNNHGYYREESVEIQPVAQAFNKSLESGKADAEALDKLQQEFRRMEKAGQRLQKAQGIAALQQEIAPWLLQFTLTGKAGATTLKALRTTHKEKRLRAFFQALDDISRMQETTRHEWRSNGTSQVADVEVGMHTMTPALHAAFRHVNRSIYASLSNHQLVNPAFTTNAGNTTQGIQAISDDNPNTFWSSECTQQAGHWYCLDFGQLTTIRTITLLMGGSRAHDLVQAGQFEISKDGQTWEPIGEPTGGEVVVLDLTDHPVQARMLRYRITEPRNNWLSIREFTINRTLPPYVRTTLAKAPRFRAYQEERYIGISRVMEVFSIQPGEFIDLLFPTPIQATNLEINLESPDLDCWAALKLTHPNGSKTTLKGKTQNSRLLIQDKSITKKAISSVRLTNASQESKEIKLTLFRLGIRKQEKDLNPANLTDSDMSTSYNVGKQALKTTVPLSSSAREMIIVGTANCQATNATPAKRTPHLQYFNLTPGAKQTVITAPRQPDKRLYEVIIR